MINLFTAIHRALRLDQVDARRFPDDVARELRRERVSQVVASTKPMAICNIVFAAATSLWFWGKGADTAILLWLCATVAVNGYGVWGHMRRDPNRPFSGKRSSTNKIVKQSLLVCLLFALAPFFLLPIAQNGDAAIVAGLAAGSLIVGPYIVYPVPRAAIAWILLAGTLNTLSFIGSGHSPFIVAGILGILMACGVARASIAQSIRMTRSFEVRQKLEENKEVISLLLREYEDSSNFWIWECHANGLLHNKRDAMLDALGVKEQSGEAVSVLDLCNSNPESNKDTRKRFRDLLVNPAGFNDLLICSQRADKSIAWISVRGVPQFDSMGGFCGYRGVASDVTEKKLAEDHIRFLAGHDPATSLPNRLTFADHVRPWGKADRPFASLHIDLDRFKLVNDTFGHLAGDELLREVASRLQSATSAAHADALCARIGGDEFVVAIPLETDGEDRTTAGPAEQLAKAIVSEIAKPFVLKAGTTNIGASVGFAVYPDDCCYNDMPSYADLALYKAKAQGRSRFLRYTKDMGQHLRDRKRLDAELNNVVERNELELVYQPIVELGDGQISGVEALLRWNHPELGEVGPDTFIPISEDNGTIIPIGEWVLERACSDAVTWSRPLSVAVNLSAKQLLSDGFVGSVTGILERTDLLPQRLELELTETVLVQDADAALSAITQLRKLGVSVALDDFGAGFSSLGYLRDFEFDRIKIDRSYVAYLGVEGEDGKSSSTTLVTAIVDLAKTMGMRITAEGIEEYHQVDELRNMGCTNGQGYLFSRPISHSDLKALCGLGKNKASENDSAGNNHPDHDRSGAMIKTAV